MRLTNPILPGFHPDPSCIRVGEAFYLVTSTFQYFPGVPVFRSRDLVNWERIAHCLTRDSQLPLRSAAPSGGIYAPTIRFHDGRFYMVTTNVTEGGNFYVHADDPAGEWSDPVFVDRPGIDPSLLFDDDGTVYFTNQGEGGIHQAEIDIATGRLLTEPRMIWEGTGGAFPEGPHLYRIDGRYYLLIAEGGTHAGHMVTLARSDDPWGPFEPCPHNPILSHRHRGAHPISATGHAELVRAGDGSWWMVFLGIRLRGAQWPHVHYLGRETFLAPVRWTDDGWPVVGDAGTVEPEMDVDLLAEQRPRPAVERDGFDTPRLDPCWNFIRNPDPAAYSLTDRPGRLRLIGSTTTLDEPTGCPTFVGRRQEEFDCVAETRLEFSPTAEGDLAGLAVLMDERHHYDLAVARRDGRREVIVHRRIGDLRAVVARRRIPDEGPVTLRVACADDVYTFSAAPDGEEPAPLATGAARYLSTETAGGFTGVYLGLYAVAGAADSPCVADFGSFELRRDAPSA